MASESSVPPRGPPAQERTPMPGRRGYLSYIPSLDGIRAIAVLAVLWYHSTAVTIGHPLGSGGFLGVSTFFTLSGFLLTALLLREWSSTGHIDLGAFWGRRLKRLAPAALTVVVAVVVAGQFWFADWGSGFEALNPISAATNIMNWYIWADVRDLSRTIGPVSPYWSLSIEEQFYVVLTVLFVVARRRSWGRRLLVGAFAALWLYFPVVGLLIRPFSGRDLYLPITRASELAAGALLALAVERWGFPRGRGRSWSLLAGWIGLAGVLAAYLFARADQDWLYTFGLAAMSVLAVGLIGGCLAGGGMARLLAWRPAVWLGQLSYSLYLVHWPIIRILTPSRVGLHGWALVALHAGASVLAATALGLLVEQPIRRRWSAPPSRVAMAWAGATLGVCALCLALV